MTGDGAQLALIVISIHAPPRGATSAATRRSAASTFQFTPLREGRRARKARRHATARFQFTPLREGRRAHAPRRRHDGRHFNSRPSARGDMISLFGAFVKPFQFTPLREGRPSVGDTVSDAPIISIHAPPRGATGSRRLRLPPYCDFNSRPSARGDGKHRQLERESAISIHAPPRGATTADGHFFHYICISIHAPPRGATRIRIIGTTPIPLFQFTPLREGRRQKICNFCKSFVQPLQISMA